MKISRYPKTQNQSLRAWSAADELTLEYIKQNKLPENAIIYNDRFGYLTCHLPQAKTICVYKSQEKAITQNFEANDLGQFTPVSLFEDLDATETALISLPKSLDLFELYLQHIYNNSSKNVVVVCSFMTRHFSKRILEIASQYFEIIEQSKAKKKARLLVLKNKKQLKQKTLVNEVTFEEHTFKQYYGVFSSKNIDYATQFLVKNLDLKSSDKTILDLASGNGVLAFYAQQKNPKAEIYLLDDFALAIESSKLNLKKAHFYYNDSLNDFKDTFFDFIISNPPFHFEHENNIEVSLELFQQVFNKLKQSGRFQLVANNHLNYKTHLLKIFPEVNITAENEKFVVYECIKIVT
jgi:16S rRNA G1207 methylase RsmC